MTTTLETLQLDSYFTPKKYRFIKNDKYGRPMFEVEDDTLSQLFEECKSKEIRSSLFEFDNRLFMIVSNYSAEVLPPIGVKVALYGGAVRFYPPSLQSDNEWI